MRTLYRVSSITLGTVAATQSYLGAANSSNAAINAFALVVSAPTHSAGGVSPRPRCSRTPDNCGSGESDADVDWARTSAGPHMISHNTAAVALRRPLVLISTSPNTVRG